MRTIASRVATPRARARRLSPADRRAQLLSCALRVFARRGLGAARHAEIAKEAGVSVSAVFFYFPTRTALLQAVLDEVERFLVEMGERVHATTDLPAPRVVLEHARAFADSVDRHPDYARVWLDWSTAIREEIWPRYLQFQERMVRMIAKTIKRGRRQGSFAADVDAEDAARLIVGSAHTVALMKFTHRTPATIDRFLRVLARAAVGAAGA